MKCDIWSFLASFFICHKTIVQNFQYSYATACVTVGNKITAKTQKANILQLYTNWILMKQLVGIRKNVNFYQLLIHHSHTNNKATKNAYNSRTYTINRYKAISCYKAMLNNKTITDESDLTFIVVYFFNSALIASLYSLLPLAWRIPRVSTAFSAEMSQTYANACNQSLHNDIVRIILNFSDKHNTENSDKKCWTMLVNSHSEINLTFQIIFNSLNMCKQIIHCVPKNVHLLFFE